MQVAADDFLDQLQAYQGRVADAAKSLLPMGEPEQFLYGPIEKFLSNMGKGFRPALMMATCGALGRDEDDALVSATALEILHNAFLVHDDIEDQSELRRSEPTLHMEMGEPLAINIGDAMNAIAMATLKHNRTRLGDRMAATITDEFEHLLLRTLEGQAIELGWNSTGTMDITAQDYIAMVLKKTCWYSFIHPCRIGALIAQRDATNLDRFNQFGSFLGVAFQIQDDVLNLDGVEAVYGKETAGDLFEGKRTLMVIHAYEHASKTDRDFLENFFARNRSQRSATDVGDVLEIIRKYDGIEYARSVARQFADACRDEYMGLFPDQQASPQLEFIDHFVGFMIERDL